MSSCASQQWIAGDAASSEKCSVKSGRKIAIWGRNVEINFRASTHAAEARCELMSGMLAAMQCWRRAAGDAARR
jgi:hypothetical protein